VFECVVNVSEGRHVQVLDELSSSTGPSLRDRHRDPFHNRSVFTLVNEPDELERDVRALIRSAFARLDITTHEGVHPRFGVVDVVPFVALEPTKAATARDLRDVTAVWIAETFQVPCFLYGEVHGQLRTLPDVRRGAFKGLRPDLGPARPAPRLGAVAVGARPVLVAWNLWLHDVSIDEARTIARAVRQPEVRALGLEVGDDVQVSCNLIDPSRVGPSAVYDQVNSLLPRRGAIRRAELVGLVPRSVLEAEDRDRWEELGLSEAQTIEGRLAGRRD
jgi:glutamate formiminotransferase